MYRKSTFSAHTPGIELFEDGMKIKALGMKCYIILIRVFQYRQDY